MGLTNFVLHKITSYHSIHEGGDQWRREENGREERLPTGEECAITQQSKKQSKVGMSPFLTLSS